MLKEILKVFTNFRVNQVQTAFVLIYLIQITLLYMISFPYSSPLLAFLLFLRGGGGLSFKAKLALRY